MTTRATRYGIGALESDCSPHSCTVLGGSFCIAFRAVQRVLWAMEILPRAAADMLCSGFFLAADWFSEPNFSHRAFCAIPSSKSELEIHWAPTGKIFSDGPALGPNQVFYFSLDFSSCAPRPEVIVPAGRPVFKPTVQKSEPLRARVRGRLHAASMPSIRSLLHFTFGIFSENNGNEFFLYYGYRPYPIAIRLANRACKGEANT